MEKKTNVPKLRFPEFEGEWVEKKLGEVCNKTISYGIVQTGDIIENGIPCVRVIDLTSNFLDVNKMITTSVEINNLYKKTILEKDDIIIALRGEIGMVIKVTPELVGCNITRGVARISCDKKQILPDFLLWSIRSPKFIEEINKRVNGSALQEIPLSNLRLVPISFTYLLEQTKIASFLTSVDDKLTQLKKKKSLLEEYKKGVMQQIFSQELRFKDDNGEDFPEWEEKRLGDIARLQGGYAFKSELFKSNGIPVIRISNISNKDNYIDLENIVFYQKNSSLENFTINSGDLIIAMSGATTGKSSIYNLPYKAYQNQRVGLFKTKTDSLYYPFLIQFVFSESFQKQLDSVLVAGAQPNVSSSDIESFIINLPYKLEQTKIANFLSAIDEKINHCSKQIERMADWKKGLLQQMFV